MRIELAQIRKYSPGEDIVNEIIYFVYDINRRILQKRLPCRQFRFLLFIYTDQTPKCDRFFEKIFYSEMKDVID